MASDEEQAERARASALRLLARREHSRRELELKLVAREFDRSLIEPLLADLVASGYLSDERFAEQFSRSRVGRGQGPNRIRAELRERGVSDEFIEFAIAELDVSWADLACEVRVSKFGAEAPTDHTSRAKQSRFLNSRGFSSEQIAIAIRFSE